MALVRPPADSPASDGAASLGRARASLTEAYRRQLGALGRGARPELADGLQEAIAYALARLERDPGFAERLSGGEEAIRVLGWLARRRARSEYRRSGRERSLDEALCAGEDAPRLADTLALAEPSAQARLELREQFAAASASYRAAPADTRAVVGLQILGLEGARIAAITGMSHEAVRQRQSRAARGARRAAGREASGGASVAA